MRAAVCLLLIAAVVAACAPTRHDADPALAAFIDTLRAVDTHAHPLVYVPPGAPADTDYDALPLDGIPPFELPTALRSSNPAYRDAQRSLYGVSGSDTGAAHSTAVEQARAALIRQHADRFPEWALDQLHVDVMLANRVVMGTGLMAPRFRWVPFADPLMLPLDTRDEALRTPDTKALYPLEAKLLQRYMRDLGMTILPPTLDQYKHDVITATLARQRAAGAVAIKFETAYLRALDFDVADSTAAATIYARYADSGVPTPAQYRLLQDYLVRFIAREAGRFGMAVQIHSLNGFGGAYSAGGAAPHLLESLLRDTSLTQTRFVIIHGGWPLVNETMSQLAKPNVYTDISMMDQLADRDDLTSALRLWLRTRPDKVMFGTDAFDAGVQQAWEQVGWVASRNARRALTDALSEMVRDEEITLERAMELARMVLRENAVTVYRLDAK